MVSKMKSLSEYMNVLLESSIERYSIKTTLKQFIDKYIELSSCQEPKQY